MLCPQAWGGRAFREVERTLSKALLGLQDDLRGAYFPLAGSYSYVPKPGGMTPGQQAELDAAHLLFHEPDSTLLLASGMGRHWPDARGVFANEARTLAVWVNEQDHCRLFSSIPSADIQQVRTKKTARKRPCSRWATFLK